MPLNLLCLSEDATLEAALTEGLAPLSDAVVLSFAAPDLNHSTAAALSSADAVLCGTFSPPLREAAPKARWIQFWSAGVDGKLYPELFREGTQVTTGSGIHATACSEHVLSLMLAFARGLPGCFAAQQNHDWSARDAVSRTIFELEGKTVGVVGAGVIGQAIGKRCQAFGMRTVGSRRDPSQTTPGFDVVLSHLQYHDLVLASDMIVLALPLTSHTRMLFGEDEIEILRKGTYLFNIARGGLIDEKWVSKALQKGWLAGAGLDVFEDEPLPPDSPFWTLPNCIVTPHIGGHTPAYGARFATLVREQAQRLLAGQPLENLVDKDLGY